MKAFASILIPILLALGALYAADAPAINTKNKSSFEFEIKNKSSFELEGNSRNPFWPISWKPTGQVTGTSAEHDAGSDIPVSAFALTSVTIGGGTRFAIINGRIMEEGQQFGLQLGTHTYQITLKSIQDGRVVLERRRTQEIVVPLRRK
jgi:hypothetical protein